MEITDINWQLPQRTVSAEVSPSKDAVQINLRQLNDTLGLEVEYRLFGTNDPESVLGRVYLPNTDSTFTYQRDIDVGASIYLSRFGRLWDCSYNIFINEISEQEAVLFKGSGSRQLYRTTDPNENFCEYNPPAGSFDVLVKEQGIFKLLRRGGDVWEFDGANRISKIKDLHGNGISFTHSSGFTTITDDDGNWVRMNFKTAPDYSCPNYEILTHIDDSFGRRWDYVYDPNDYRLKEVVSPLTDEYQDRLSTVYTYSGSELTSITDGAGQTWLTNTYTDGKVSAQTYGDGEFTITYGTNSATVYNRRGFKRYITLSDYGLPLSVTDYESDGLTGYTTQYYYDFEFLSIPEALSKRQLWQVVR